MLSEHLVNTEEVNFGSLDLVSLSIQIDEDSTDESHHLASFTNSNAESQFWVIVGWTQSPSQKFFSIIESEISIVIFNVVAMEQLIELEFELDSDLEALNTDYWKRKI